jgi:nucleoside-diphosphate-sugar epimerase
MDNAVDCLITGATGVLARSVVPLLLQKSASVRCLVRSRSNSVLPRSWLESSNLEILHGNLLSPTDVDRALEGIRVIYHLAAESRGLPATIFAGTVVGSKNLLRAILRVRPARVVLVSSLNVYGLANADPRVPVTEAFGIEERPEKRDVYTHSKVWQERLFWEYLSGTGIELTVLRPAYIYGPSQQHLPARMGLCIGNLLLQTNPHAPLAITYVENCADAVVFCGTSKDAANEIYNIVDDDVPTASRYLRLSRGVKPRVLGLTFPFWGLTGFACVNRLAYLASAGHIPLELTHYKSSCMWRGHHFSAQKLKGLGWKQPIATDAALERTFSRRSVDGYIELPLRGGV